MMMMMYRMVVVPSEDMIDRRRWKDPVTIRQLYPVV